MQVIGLRCAWRWFLQHRGWTAATVATIALIVGGLTTPFAVAYGLFFMRLPIPNASRAFALWEENRETGLRRLPLTESAYPIYRRELAGMATLAYFIPPDPGFPVRYFDGPTVTVARASPELFGVLQAVPLIGRTFAEAEGIYPSQDVAVLSHRTWSDRYGKRTDVLGQKIDLSMAGTRTTFTVVGVMQPGFDFPYPLHAPKPDLWTNAQWIPGRFLPGNNYYTIGVLAPSVSLEVLRQLVRRVSESISRQEPRFYGAMSADAVCLRGDFTRESRRVVGVLGAAFFVVVLLGCANLVHLCSARNLRRHDATFIRIALGAQLIDLFSLASIEIGMLLVSGCALGGLVSYWMLASLGALLPMGLHLPRATDLLSEPAVLAAAAVGMLPIAAVLGFALWLDVSRGVLRIARSGQIRERPLEPRRARWTARVLLAGQIALAFALTATALSLFQRVRSAVDEHASLDPNRLLVVELFFPPSATKAAIPALESCIRDLAASERVGSAALADSYPPSNSLIEVTSRGAAGPIGRGWHPAELHVATHGYLAVARMETVSGRWFDSRDTPGGDPVAVVNETLVKRYFPATSPIGGSLQSGRGDLPKSLRIVGVVKEPRKLGATEPPRPAVYVSWDQWPLANAALVLRSREEARKIAKYVSDEVVRSVPAGGEVLRIRTGMEIVAESFARARFVSSQMIALAVICVVVAVTGLAGVLAYLSELREREMAIRLALGCSALEVLRLMVGDTLKVAGFAVVMGCPLAFALDRWVRQVTVVGGTNQLWIWVATGLLFCVVAGLASLPTALRLSRVEPAVHLPPDRSLQG